jgi:glycosyltransferase involved in cell wall biosynthesis
VVSILMVGTIEPRKGYCEALAAFEDIWRDPSAPIMLTIVGRYGWGMPALLAQLRSHSELGKRLFWQDSATDEEVQAAYRAADCLLLCSHGEGFGLPIIEAMQYGVPLVLRDIPEFREVAEEHAIFFSDGDLRDVLRNWISAYRSGDLAASKPVDVIGWDVSARQLLAATGVLPIEVGAQTNGF